MSWIIQLLYNTRRLRGLSETQLRDLITHADLKGLKIIKDHLEIGSFKFVHLEKKADALISECVDRAKEIQWQLHVEEIRAAFLEGLGDLL